MEYKIIYLSKGEWKGTALPIGYTTDKYYDVKINKTNNGFVIGIVKKDFPEPVTHTPEEYDFPDRLYEDYRENACARGILIDGVLIAAVETEPETWSNRLRITELWVTESHQRRGIGHALIETVKAQAVRERRRAVILETQSCNVNAVDFYLHEGFNLIGMDSCCYNNGDLSRKEVRLEFGWFPDNESYQK
ncbi:MAG: GNAT family N-acetyltransferase [Eubacteriales bacterium]|jgi:GNAT superfamily N-acetyltransferase|nr:GNAT family N-acetyltransferase [Eubacteriales bacterium]